MEETPEKKKRRRHRHGVSKAIIANARNPFPLSPVDLADALDVKPDSIYQLSARLRKQGRLAPSERQDSGLPSPMAPDGFLVRPPTDWTANDLAAIDRLPILSADQRKKLLTAIAMRPAGGLVQASAVGKLDDLDKGAASQIGPPAPLTEVQQIERLSRLMRAVGQPVATKAMEAAFEQGKDGENLSSSPVEVVPAGDN
jgi:hypothetical protein